MALPADLPRASLSERVFRVVRAGIDPLATAGSLKTGGRYNPPGGFSALYAALDPQTAIREVARGLRLRGVDPAHYPDAAWWIYELEVALESVLDLTDPDVLRRLSLSPESLLGPGTALTRAIATEARAAGFQALVAPSAAAPGAKNLVVFSDLLAEPPLVVASRPVLSLASED